MKAAYDDEHGLVAVPGEGAPEAPMGAASRALAVAIIAAVFTVLVGTPLYDALHLRPPKRLLGAELRADEELRASARWSDGTKMKLLESDYKRRSTVRLYAGTYYGSYLLRHLRETIPAGVAGADDWLFLAERLDTPEGPPERASLRAAAERAAIARRFGARGSRYVVVPLPRKAAFVPEVLPMGVDPRPECDVVMAETFRRLGVEAVDLFEALEEDERARFYVKRDTHWNDFGLRRSAEEVARHLGEWRPEGARLGTIEPDAVVAFAGDLYGWTNTHPMFFSRELAPPMKDVIRLDGAPLPRPGNSARIAQVGTSFSGLALFADMIAHFIGEPIQCKATVGGSGWTSLRELLEARGDGPYPEVVLEELPAHMAFQAAADPSTWSLHADLVTSLGAPPPSPGVRLALGSRIVPEDLPRGGAMATTSGRWVATLEEGDLARSGGAAEVLVALEVTEGSARVNVDLSPLRISLAGIDGARQVALPLLAEGESSSAVKVGLSTGTSGASMRAAGLSVDIAVFADPGSEVRTPFREEGTGVWLADAGSVPIAPGATLVVSMPGTRADGQLRDVTVEATSSDGALSQRWTFERLNAGGLAIVAPGLLAGGELGTVRITGTNPARLGAPDLRIFALSDR